MTSESIDDDEGLLRRIPPWHEPVLYQTAETSENLLRPPSDAFSLEEGEEGLSFHLESSLRGAGEQLTYGCPEGVPGWAVARITAGELRRLGLRLVRDGQPHHVQVLGLSDLSRSKKRRIQREIAKASRYVVPPRAS